MQETTLRQLIDKEKELVREIQSLDSEMQTLVYENYNKFILATDTIRQMKSDFKAMEDEMGKLVAEMSEISSFSNNISQNLQVLVTLNTQYLLLLICLSITNSFFFRIAIRKFHSYPTPMSSWEAFNFCLISQKLSSSV